MCCCFAAVCLLLNSCNWQGISSFSRMYTSVLKILFYFARFILCSMALNSLHIEHWLSTLFSYLILILQFLACLLWLYISICYGSKTLKWCLNSRLQDVVHSEKRIYLVFEYLDLDLKKHMDSCPELAKDPCLIKVRFLFCFICFHYKFYIHMTVLTYYFGSD